MDTFSEDRGITVDPIRQSIAIGDQTGIHLPSRRNICIGHAAGFQTRSSNNVLIGTGVDGEGNEVKIGNEQVKVTIGIYKLHKLMDRIETLERELRELREYCWAPGGPIPRIAANRFYERAADIDQKSNEPNELKGLDEE